ncbi:MAG: molybdopterin cofactor-binding domain-containing protein, partial [Bradyrhizobium sp.]|nr:molybdopterin cofactor-binding domain-containing protein [Bradyrhizobium sp.]
IVHNHLIGGGFGRRLEADGAVRAVEIARHVDGPVKVVWTREEDIQHDMYRPYWVDRIEAGLDKSGRPIAWINRFAGSSVIARWLPPAFSNGLDPDTTEGAIDLVYSLPNFHVEYVRVEPPGIPTAFWRSVGPSHNVFVTESFIDELAAAARQDAVAYRRALLDHNTRARAVLDLAAEKKPLLHLWSLAIEEQYYIVWPILLLLIGSRRRRSRAITLALAAASFIACLIVQPRAPDYAFYLPVTRAWELLVGSGLALWLDGRDAEARPQRLIDHRLVRELIAWAALLAIVVAFWRYGRPTPHPGVHTLLPVLGAAGLIATSGTLVHRYILSSMPAVFVGLISYPLYLWHYPLMAY